MGGTLTRTSRALLAAGALGLVASQLISTNPAQAAETTGPGSAFATAAVLTVGPQYGGYALTVTAGTTSASYQEGEAQATSADLDFASSLASVTSSLPTISEVQPLSVDSSGGPSSETGGTQEVGTEAASVKGTPAAQSSLQLVALDLPGVIEVQGEANTSAAFGGGSRQGARAAADLTVELAGGLVTLDGLDWNATQSTSDTGTTATSTVKTSGTFTVGSIEVAGAKLPTADPSQLTGAIKTANSVLASTGIAVALPATSVDPTSGTVAVNGLDIRLSRSVISPAVNALLGPTADVEQKVNDALAAGGSGLSQIATYAGTGELVAGILLGILAGAGEVNLIVGGVSADSATAPPFTNPLGPSTVVDGDGSTPGTPAIATHSTSAPSGSQGDGTGTPTPAGRDTPGAAQVGGHGNPTADAQIPASRNISSDLIRCTTTSPSGHPGCWRGLAAAAAGGLLLVGIGLFAGEIYVSRRQRFRVLKENSP
jgi:hypothetical protein